ncbi:MAG TPA: META domain-containing protein [Moheibacter sp.]|nr:META domain-containing protein [Moheibacter sp.]
MREVILGLLVFITAACQSQKIVAEMPTENPIENAAQSSNELLGKWTLEYMSPVDGKNVKDLYKMQMPYLNFVDQNKVAGNNGCNNIAGSYQSENKSIQFHTNTWASTRMFCQNVNEAAFLNALKTINRYSLVDDGQRLMLMTSDIATMILVKTEE